MAVVYKYTDVLDEMYGKGDVKFAKRVRPVTFAGPLCRGVATVKNIEAWAKSDAGSLLYLFPLEWSSSLDALSVCFSKAMDASEDLVVSLVVLGATGVPSDKSDNAHIGDLTELKELVSGVTFASAAAYAQIRLTLTPYVGKTLFELVNSTENEKAAFEPFKKTSQGFLALKVTTKSTHVADDTNCFFRIGYVQGVPTGMPLDKISV